MSEFTVAFGRALEYARRRRGWRQEELAERAGLNRGYVGGVERGDRNPTLDVIVKLALALEVSPTALMAAAEEEAKR